MKILLLEDEKAIGELILSHIKKWKMHAELVQTPHEALARLETDDIDLLITDQLLPEMTGTDLVKKLHGTDRYKNLDVLMISGQADKRAIIKANEAGITDFMTKPLDLDELKKRLFAIRKTQRQQTRQRQIGKVWRGRKRSMHDIFSPHIVFGEPLSKSSDLKKPANRHLVPYLNNSCEIIDELNASDIALQLGYVIEDNTADIIVPLVRHAAKKWIRLILISTQCPGKPILLVRLFTINGRNDYMPVVLVYDQPGDLDLDERKGLRRLGVKILKRSSLDRERLEKLIRRHLGKKKRRRPKKEVGQPSQEDVLRSRILTDLEAMTSLPVLPQVYQRILELARDPDSDIQRWIQAVQLDPMTCAVVFRWANSPSYGFKGRITDIGRAVILLGKDAIRNIVASQSMLEMFKEVQEQGFNLNDFWHHNLAVGYAAYILGYPLDADLAQATHGKALAAMGLEPEAEKLLHEINLPARLNLDYAREVPFIGGIMHDLGKGAMVQSYPGLFSMLLVELQKANWQTSMLGVEQELTGGLTHTVVGEILARQWGLDEELCQVILHHHQPQKDNAFTLLISLSDAIGQILYPFPKGPHNPLAKALEAGDLSDASPFLPAGFFDNPLLSPKEFIALARAIAPKVRHYTEQMSQSI